MLRVTDRVPDTPSEAPPASPRKASRGAVRGRRRVHGRAALVLLALPATAFFVVFSYAPLAGLAVAFKNFSISDGVFGSPWNGLDNFRFFFDSGDARRILWNTLSLNVLFIAATTVCALGLAVMINEIRFRYLRKFLQSSVFLPYFISPVVVSIMLQGLLAGVGGQGGAVNKMLNIFALPSVSWYSEPGAWPWILTVVKVWQMSGYLSVIYLAAITAIPVEVYEAAAIDGASRWRMALRITVPLLAPTTVTLLMLSVGRIFYGDFGTIYAIIGDNGTLFSTTDVIDTYVFRSLRQNGDFGMTAAIGLFQSVVGLVFVLVTTFVARRFGRDTRVF
ncbi:ABC transporter permease subunit [Actinacidiphila alni]|uniref:ABC transporter permease n=1 Tax=Actinacidiphila alni TaxID=380248 RepID=UPI0033EB9262